MHIYTNIAPIDYTIWKHPCIFLGNSKYRLSALQRAYTNVYIFLLCLLDNIISIYKILAKTIKHHNIDLPENCSCLSQVKKWAHISQNLFIDLLGLWSIFSNVMQLNSAFNQSTQEAGRGDYYPSKMNRLANKLTKAITSLFKLVSCNNHRYNNHTKTQELDLKETRYILPS